eukprot:244084_1
MNGKEYVNHLFYGYIRDIQNSSIQQMLIPNDVVDLCIQYWRSSYLGKVISISDDRATSANCGEIELLDALQINKKYPICLYFYVSMQYELKKNDIVEFKLSYFKNGTAYLGNKIISIKYADASRQYPKRPQTKFVKKHDNDNDNLIDLHESNLKYHSNRKHDKITIENEENERKFKIARRSILYDMRIYIDVPYEADDDLRTNCRELNQQRPLNQFDRISDGRRQEIHRLQNLCVFYWIRYWCVKFIDNKQNVPLFIKYDILYQMYFERLMNEYIYDIKVNNSIQLDSLKKNILKVQCIEFSPKAEFVYFKIMNETYEHNDLNTIETPFEYFDEITDKIMNNPVMCALDGKIYDKESIIQFVMKYKKTPNMDYELMSNDLIYFENTLSPLVDLKKEIDQFKKKHGL